MTTLNDFTTDLAYSLEQRESELFDQFYYRVFPHLSKIIFVDDIAMQKQGIDKVLVLQGGKRIYIDEKKRRKDYGDILLEEYSNWERKIVGWLGKRKRTDYIVYAVMPSRTVYLLPFLLLQKAWIRNYRSWLIRYGRVWAKNLHYTTTSIPVPVTEVLRAIRAEMEDVL